MISLPSVLQSSLGERIGWTLVHSVWQLAIVAALFAVISIVLRRRSANVRYVLGCVALMAMVAAPAGTFVAMPTRLPMRPVTPATPAGYDFELLSSGTNETLSTADAVPVLSTPMSPDGTAPRIETTPATNIAGFHWNGVASRLTAWQRRLEPALPWLSAGWLAGVALLAMRPLVGLINVHRLRRRGLKPLSTELRELAGRLMAELRIHRAVQVAESALVQVPTVVGYLRPIVLLPASAVTGLTSEQLELILAHELAHVRRHDYLVNLVQTAIEALLFYHPAMWWVSTQVRRERENCCDDLAVARSDDRRTLVQALCAIEQHRQALAPALAASGGSLVDRARRLLVGPPAASAFDRATAWLAGLIALGVVAAVLSLGRSYGDETVANSLDGAIEEKVEEQAVEQFDVQVDLSEESLADLKVEIDERVEHDTEVSVDVEEIAVAVAADLTPAVDVAVEAEAELSIDAIIHTLATYQACPVKKSLRAKIIKSADEVRKREEGHVIVGRVVVEGNDDPTSVTAQMSILSGGYFAGPVRDLSHPVGFRMHGYAPYELELAKIKWQHEEVVDVGTIEMKRLPDSELVPVVGRVELEGDGDPRTVSVRLSVMDGSVNTPSNGTEPRSRFAEPTQIRPDENGRLYKPGFSPIKYYLVAMAPGYVRHEQRLAATASGVIDLGTIRLEKPRPVKLDYIIGKHSNVDEPEPFDLDKLRTASLEGGSRWPVTPRKYGWDLEFDQKDGQLFFDWSYGPVYLAHLGAGELADYLDADGRIVTNQPRDFTVTDGHVYLLRRPNWEPDKGEYWVLFRVRLGDGQTPQPAIQRATDTRPKAKKPWIAVGRVTGASGEPMVDVVVQAHVGVGTLRTTGKTTTDARGKYRLEFGPGILFLDAPKPLQAATITASKPGYSERNLNRQGDYVAGYTMPADSDKRWGKKSEQVFLPGKPLKLDFVMQPAAVLQGTFVESSGDRPMREQSFYLTGRELPPSSSSLRSVTTDRRGRFRVAAIPTGYDWRLGMRIPHTAMEIETEPLNFDEPGAYRCKLVLDTKAGDSGGVQMSLRVEDFRQLATPEKVTTVDQLDADGFSKLHRAASGGHVDRVRELLERGANVNVEQGTFHGTPLQYAASNGHGETVQSLVDHGATVDARDANGRTPLIWAATRGHDDVIRRLLDAGADVNATNDGGWTPLHYAVDKGHEQAAQLLIDRGANIHAANSQGKTPVDLNPNLNLRIPWRALERPRETGDHKATERSENSRPAAATVERRSEAQWKSPHEPTDVVAEIRGEPIEWQAIAPSDEWFAQRAEYEQRNGHTRGYESPGDYPVNRLTQVIWAAVLEEYKRDHEVEPTTEELAEFMLRRHQTRLARMTVDSPPAKIDPQHDRFSAEWYVGRWKLQQSLYKQYGGRVIWQQVGPEAIDAMRDLLKEKHAAELFEIRDEQLRERFWDPYLRENPGVLIRDPDKVFKHPWSTLDEPAN